MIDILNEFGLNYSSDSSKKKNVYEVFVNIYFPLIVFTICLPFTFVCYFNCCIFGL